MSDGQNPSYKFDQLRSQAEALVRNQSTVSPSSSPDILEFIHELTIYQAELEIQNEEFKRAQQEISDLHHEYEDLYEFAPCGYVKMNARGIIKRINLTGASLIGKNRQVLPHSIFSQFIARDWEKIYLEALQKTGQTGKKQSIELLLNRGKDQPTWVRADIKADRDKTGAVFRWRMVLVDISSKKEIERTLDDAHHELEIQVDEQTRDLRQVNIQLKKEIDSRRQTQVELAKKAGELEERSIGLEEANAALKVLLREIKNERRALEEKVVCNIDDLVRPHIAALVSGRLTQRQRILLDTVNRNLDDIASPLSRRFIIDGRHLTPIETQVANLIRQGSTTKEIAVAESEFATSTAC